MGNAGGVVPVGALFLWRMFPLILPTKISGHVDVLAFALAFNSIGGVRLVA